MLEQAGGHNRVELPALHLLRFHLLLHLLWQPRLQALFYLTEDEQIKNEKKLIHGLSTEAKQSWTLAFTMRWQPQLRLAEGSKLPFYF